jgi:predicted O-methyltransferase YrrM
MLKTLFYYFPYKLQFFIIKLAESFYSANIIDEFINNKEYGEYFNIGKNEKKYVLKRLKLSLSKVASATSLEVQILLIMQILKIKRKNIRVVECGCYKGASTIALSIVCKLIEAKLIVYDSFEGLPYSEKNLGLRNYPHLHLYGFYKKGMYKGALKEVKNNLKLYGEISVCEFRVGNFEESLKNHKEKIDFLFLDVDLTESTLLCIKYLWKKLRNNSYVYSDDACDLKVATVWFDNKWWERNLNEKAPGHVGSGCGLPLRKTFSSIGYSYKTKFNKSKNLKIYSWLYNK